MMSRNGGRDAEVFKRFGIGAVLFVVAIVFVIAFTAGESRAEKRAARVVELSNLRLDTMKERLETCTHEQMAIKKGTATRDTSLKTLQRNKEILVKEISELQETIKLDRQTVNDCHEEADNERRMRTGTTEEDAQKAFQGLQEEEIKVSEMIDDAKENAVGGTSVLKRLIRAYALENKALSLQLMQTIMQQRGGLMGANDALRVNVNSTTTSLGDDAGTDGKGIAAVDASSSTTNTSASTSNATDLNRALHADPPGLQELKALLYANERRKAALEKNRRPLAGEVLVGSANGTADNSTSQQSRKTKKSLKHAFTSPPESARDKQKRIEGMLIDLEEGLQALEGVQIPAGEAKRQAKLVREEKVRVDKLARAKLEGIVMKNGRPEARVARKKREKLDEDEERAAANLPLEGAVKQADGSKQEGNKKADVIEKNANKNKVVAEEVDALRYADEAAEEQVPAKKATAVAAEETAPAKNDDAEEVPADE